MDTMPRLNACYVITSISRGRGQKHVKATALMTNKPRMNWSRVESNKNSVEEGKQSDSDWQQG